MFDLVKISKSDLSPNTFENLIQDLKFSKIGAVIISNFWDEIECTNAVKRLSKIGFDYYEGVHPPLAKLGISQFEFGSNGSNNKSEYFKKAKTANLKRSLVFEDKCPIQEIISLLTENNNAVSIAQELGEDYFVGIVRNIRNGVLFHLDFAQIDAKEWIIENITHQLTWNLILSTSKYGGITTVYDKLFSGVNSTNIC
jgi:hypothetical protein